jgi:RNA polymerase sigma-70 factor (sigma-E family)
MTRPENTGGHQGRATATESDHLVALFNDRYQPMVRMAAWLLGDSATAEDVVQDAFARLHGSSVDLASLDSAAAYLRVTVVNLTRTRRKRQKLARTRHVDGPLTTPGPEAYLVDEQLAAAIGGLPGRQRECVVLRFGEDLTVDQIAAALGIGSGSVKTHLHRGLRALEQQLDGSTERQNR